MPCSMGWLPCLPATAQRQKQGDLVASRICPRRRFCCPCRDGTLLLAEVGQQRHPTTMSQTAGLIGGGFGLVLGSAQRLQAV